MSNFYIFVWALAVYVIAVFVTAFALLRMRSDNQSLRERVRDLEARLRSRPDGRPGGTGSETGVPPQEATSAGGGGAQDE